MTSQIMFRTPYDIRVDLVKDTIMASAKLDDKDAAGLAVDILKALTSIPEQMR